MARDAIDSARRRMAGLLVTDNVQARIARLHVNPGEFAADVIEQYTSSFDAARLDASEVFAVMELAAKAGIDTSLQKGEMRLLARKGRAMLMIGFSGLYALAKRGKNWGF